MHHIILHLCMITKSKGPQLYFLCTVYVGIQINMDTRKEFVGSLCKCSLIVIAAGMLPYECGLWSPLLSLPDMPLSKFITHYTECYIGAGYLSI
jgi:hypothetical protein